MYGGLIINVFVVGFCGIIAQTLLLRELLTLFEGNEFSLGIIFANWLFSETLGILFLGRKLENRKEKIFFFVLLQCLFIFSLLFSLIFIRCVRIIFNTPIGVSLNIFQIFLSSTIALFFPAFFHGCLYTYSVKLLEDAHHQVLLPISYAYIYELGGTIIGGIVFTFILLKFFNSFDIVFVITVVIIIAGVLLSFYEIKDIRTTILLTSLSIIVFFSLFIGLPKKFEEKTNSVIWKTYNLLFAKNSMYGKIFVTKQENQYTFYLNSLPVLTIPTSDTTFIEELVHIPFSLIEKTEKHVLILSGGAGGLISEIKKYKNTIIDYVELDPELINNVMKFTPEEIENVNLYYTDARYFVNKTKKVYDIVYIGTKEPKDLQMNRLFTLEFFKILQNKINKDGILVFTTPGSLVYLPKDLLVFNKIVFETIKNFFSFVNVIPGDGYNIIICSNQGKIFSSQTIFEKIKKNNIPTKSLTKSYLEYRLQQNKTQQFLEKLDSIKIHFLNQDYNPQSVIYVLRYWVGKVSEGRIEYEVFKFVTDIKKLRLNMLLLFLIIISICLFFLFKKSKKNIVLYSIFSTGYTAMVMNLVLLFIFQVVYGYIYYLIAILTSVFMLGLVLGCFLGTKLQYKISLPIAELLIIASTLFVGVIIKILNGIQNDILVYILFFIILMISSVSIGLEIPIFSKILYQENQKLIKTTSIVFAFDTLGGWFGGILGGMIIFPVLGLNMSLVIIILLKLISLGFNYAKEFV